MSIDRAIEVWLVEDDQQYRESVVAVLASSPGFRCGMHFASADKALALASTELGTRVDWPDVILLDINLPGTDGLTAIRALKAAIPDAAIVMLTIRDETETIFQAFRSGASGYLLKNATIDQLLNAVEEAARGGTLMPAAVARRVLGVLGQDRSDDYDLTAREKDVLREMTNGKSQPQIADALFVSRHTVNSHIQRIYEKLHVHSGVEAVAKAFRERLVS